MNPNGHLSSLIPFPTCGTESTTLGDTTTTTNEFAKLEIALGGTGINCAGVTTLYAH